MALGTPTSAAVAYSASGGTSVSPAYPSGLAAGDVIVMFIGQKPSTANGGTVTTPTGWTLQDSLTGAGGYGTTLGADTGNTNLFVYTKDTVTGSETGTLSVALGTNNVTWAFMIRVPVGNGTVSYGTADGQRTTTPTSPMSIALTNGASATNFQAGDLALWAMCIPTDVTTPSQFSAESITATGATFGTAVEFNEPDSTTGNDIGGYSAYASVSSGSSTTAPTVTTNITGTLTNVRGPVVLLRVRETAPPSQSLTQTARYDNSNTFYGPTVDVTNTVAPARYDNTNTFYSPTVTPGAANLTPARYDNTNAFYAATVTQTGGAQTLTQTARYDNSNSFYAATVTATRNLTPARLDNTNAFYTATVGRGPVTLSPARYNNSNTFYSPTVTATRNLAPSRYDNTNVFYSATVTQGTYVINQHTRLDNVNTFYSATVTRGAVNLSPARYNNTNVFYSATVTRGTINLAPARYDNANAFYSPTVVKGAIDLAPARYDNTNTFYSATVAVGPVTLSPARYDNTNVFYSPTVQRFSPDQFLSPARYDNTNSFYTAAVTELYHIRFEDYVDPGYVDPGYIGLAVENTQTWYTATLAPGPVTIAPARYDNTNTFYTATVRSVYALQAPLTTNVNSFYSPTVIKGAANIAPSRYNNTNVFYSATVGRGPVAIVQTARYDNTNIFYSSAVTTRNDLLPSRYNSPNVFYSATVVLGPPPQPLFPARYNNANVFYSATITTGPVGIAPALFVNRNRFPNQTVLIYPWNPNNSRSPLVSGGAARSPMTVTSAARSPLAPATEPTPQPFPGQQTQPAQPFPTPPQR